MQNIHSNVVILSWQNYLNLKIVTKICICISLKLREKEKKNNKAVVAGAAGPASAVPLFWPTMVFAVPLFFDRRSISYLSLNESRLIDEIIINTRNSCHQGKGAKTNITGITKRIKTMRS